MGVWNKQLLNLYNTTVEIFKMDNFFEIPLTYNDKTYCFPAELIPTAYSYRIEVTVFDKIISFEPDEERDFRAVLKPEDWQLHDSMDKTLLATIAAKLVFLFR